MWFQKKKDDAEQQHMSSEQRQEMQQAQVAREAHKAASFSTPMTFR